MSDPTGTIAKPYRLIEGRTDKEAAKEISAIVSENEVSVVVLGLPVNMDGSEGFRVDRTREFAAVLENELEDCKLEFYDERLTSVQANQSLRMMEVSSRKRKQKVDKMAASLLLQSYLDKRKGPDPYSDLYEE